MLDDPQGTLAALASPGANALAFSADGTRLAEAAEDGHYHTQLVVWELGATPPTRRAVAFGQDRPAAVAISRDGRYVALSEWDGPVRVWDLQAPGTPASALPTPAVLAAGVSWFVAFSPDGQQLASGIDDTPALWDVPALLAAAAPDGSGIASTPRLFAVGPAATPAPGRPCVYTWRWLHIGEDLGAATPPPAAITTPAP